MIDCHVHTARCGHGEGNAADYVAAARERGIDVLTFTEHLPLPEHLDPIHEYSMPVGELQSYVDELRELAQAQRGSGGTPVVRIGIEADWLPSELRHVETLLASQDFDMVLGSVHFLDEWAFDDPRLADQWHRTDVDAAWERYFALLADAASSGMFDVIAHPDLVKKFGHRPSYDPKDLYGDAASAFAGAGVAIEVNTAGLRKPVGELYPAPDFLAACRRAGVPATIGSDAHKPHEVGFAFGAAQDALRAAGYEQIVSFVAHEPKEHSL